MKRRLHLWALRLYARLPRRARRRVVRMVAPTYSVGAMCFIERDDGDLLLVQLAYRHRWGVPGGLLKRGEDPVAAAHREVREEVGIEIVISGEPAVVADAGARRIDIVFRARLAPGQEPDLARPGSPEIVTLGWFPRDALPELQVETSGALVALARSAARPQAVALPDGHLSDANQERRSAAE